MKKNLVLIPGLGDRHWAYGVAAAYGRWKGYTTHIHVIGWSEDAKLLTQKQREFMSFIRTLEGGVYVVGISAGGSFAAGMYLSHPHDFKKVVTLCSPYQRITEKPTSLLRKAIDYLESQRANLTTDQNNLLSIYACYDNVVPKYSSKPRYIPNAQIYSFFHAPSILLGLTVLSRPLYSFFKKSS